jgi:hypothetical protein
MSELRVVSIQVRNVLGARELGLTPGGKYTVLSGRNGSGKSTALASVQAALGGGNLATLAHVPTVEEAAAARGDKDAFVPEVVLVLQGPGSEAYRVTRKGDKVNVKARVGNTAAFEDVGKPQTWLRALYDPAGANPVAFLQAKDADRARMLLEALPLTYDRQALFDTTGILVSDLPAVPEGLHPLEELALYRDALFNTRRGVNRDKEGKEHAAEQVRLSAPAEIPTAPGEDEETVAEAEQRTLAEAIAREEEQSNARWERADYQARAAHTETTSGITATFKRDVAKLRTEHDRFAAETRAEAERRIAAAAVILEERVQDVRDGNEKELDNADGVRDAALASAAAAHDRERAALIEQRNALSQVRERLTNIKAQREVAAAAKALHDQAKRFDEEAEELKTESARLTTAITALDAFTRRLASDLPIEGLEITGKEIRVHGIPYEQLNTAQRVDIAVRVATLRAKGQRLPVVFVDGAEALDREHFDLLVARLEREAVQAFIGRVEDHELNVITDETPGGRPIEDQHVARGKGKGKP